MIPPLRIGSGFDVHRLVPDRDLWICGVKIPHHLGLLGHSDADVALHALCDALLGALALGDIGKLFPDSDPLYKGIDSKILLRCVAERIDAEGWCVVNADITIIAERPKFRPYIDSMRETVASVLSLAAAEPVTPDRISIKATTTETLGFTGRREGIAARATVLLAAKA